MSVNPKAAEKLLVDEVVQHVLRLRELLVRWDENMKAWQLLSCVPYWAIDDPRLAQARAEQFEMVKHAIDPDAYEAYYGENPHEQPFEQQTGLTVQTADQVPRVSWLINKLIPAKVDYVIDLSANDGWMLAYLRDNGIDGRGFDLNAGAVSRAVNERGVNVRRWNFLVLKSEVFPHEDVRAPAVVLFETVEHLPDPVEGLHAAASYVRQGGHLYVSTPIGAVEGGDLDSWAHVERKGHLWSFRPDDFHAMLAQVGDVQGIYALPDGTMAAEVRVG